MRRSSHDYQREVRYHGRNGMYERATASAAEGILSALSEIVIQLKKQNKILERNMKPRVVYKYLDEDERL